MRNYFFMAVTMYLCFLVLMATVAQGQVDHPTGHSRAWQQQYHDFRGGIYDPGLHRETKATQMYEWNNGMPYRKFKETAYTQDEWIMILNGLRVTRWSLIKAVR